MKESQRSDRATPVIHLMVTAVVAAGVAFAVVRPDPLPVPASDAVGRGDVGLGDDVPGDLDRRLAALEAAWSSASTARLPSEVGPAETVDPMQAAEANLQVEDWRRRVEARLALLESRPAAAARRPVAPDDVVAALFAGRAEVSPEQLEEARSTILAAAPEQEKLVAWRLLRNHPEARTDAVVQEMARIGGTSEDAATRADVWRQAHSEPHPLLRQPLLTALVADPDADVRDEAAETLDRYRDDPDVIRALEAAAAQDESAGVRARALRSLERLRSDR